ncbi:MAG: outer membrane lipoprotein-sorting protein [Puniceicoccaceae bacterium]
MNSASSSFKSYFLRRLLVLSACLGGGAPAFALTADEIAERASAVAYYQGDDGRAEVTMSITDARGRERRREMTLLRKSMDQPNGPQRFFVYFTAPADVSGTTFLVWKNPGSQDQRWLYLPALDLVRRIAATDERTSFVGSHFFYEDVSGRAPGDDNHTLDREDDLYFVLRSVPRQPETVEFAYYITYIHRPTFLPVKTEYYRSGDNPYRTYEALEVEEIGGFLTVTKARMSDLDSGGTTTLAYNNVRYNLGVPPKLFTEQYLRNPPTEVLR